MALRTTSRTEGSDPPQGDDTDAPSTNTASARRSGRSASLSKRYGLLAFLATMVAAFSIASPDVFATVANFQSIGQTNSVIALLALASLFPLIVGEFDLTVAAVVGLSAIVTTKLSQHGVPLPLTIPLAGCVGILVGLVNAFCVNMLGVSSLITTLGLGSVIIGVTTQQTNGNTVSDGVPEELIEFAQGFWLEIPYLVLVVLVTALVIWYATERTPLGREFYATGMNREAARLMGARIKRNVTLAFVLSGLIAALAGTLQLGVVQVAGPSTGAEFLLPALSVAFLGASTIRPGWFNVPGTLVAVVVVGTGIVGLQIIGVPFWVAPIFNGLVLVLAVAVATVSVEPFRSAIRTLMRWRTHE